VVPEEIEVTCEHCGREYVISDTGERPLYHACPHCGHSDVLDDGEVEAEEELVPGTIRETPTGERELILRCTNCQHVFPTPYTDERPLYAYCPSCGRKGVLEEGAGGEETAEPEVDEDAFDEPGPEAGEDAFDEPEPDDDETRA
jgi:predicted  nucleic acid-binding Zn-ribbon protein